MQNHSGVDNRALAADAGRKGGRAVAPEVRSFSTNVIWHPKRDAKAVERLRASVDDG
jgi:hypothetical protein